MDGYDRPKTDNDFRKNDWQAERSYTELHADAQCDLFTIRTRKSPNPQWDYVIPAQWLQRSAGGPPARPRN